MVREVGIITIVSTRPSLEGVRIPLLGNSVYILFISSTRLSVFLLNFDTLIKYSVETFSHSYAQNLKHLRMRNSRLFFYRYYWQISWHAYQLETCIKDTPWEMGSQDRVMNVVTRNLLELLNYNVCNFLVEMSTFKQAIKLSFGRKKFDKRTVHF